MSISRFREITLRAARTFTKGYSEVQSKVREATSNDPWVSEKQLEEIAKLTNNPDFFQEIVGVLEKRLNDIGKNWRHVLKALIVLEYAFQKGSGSLFTHFKGKIYIINTLKEFRYVEGKQDFGAHVRQQAMHVADLLMLDSPHRLREKRKTRPDILRTSATASFPLDDPAQHQDVQHPRRRSIFSASQSTVTLFTHSRQSVGRDEVRTSGSCSQPSTTIIQQASSDCSAVGPVSQLERKDAEIEWQSFWQEGSLSDVMSALGRAFSAEYKLECLQLVRSIKIYKGLVAYVYAQQRIENGKPDIFESIRQALSEWESWDDPECLSGHAIIRNKLWIILQEGSSHQKPASQDIDLQKIIDFDLETMRIKAMVILTDRREKKIFLSLCCTNPIPAMDLLQILLDTPNLPMQSHSQLAWALSRLAKMSGCYPNGLILGDIRRTETHPIAGGGFADVWKGSFIEQPVALKAFRIFQKSPQEKALNEFAREAVIWRQLRHPNILPFYGVFKGDEHFDRLCLVSPWMDEGNVMEYLSKHVESNRISLLRDVASGLEYLHGFEPAIVHGDLKGANIFFTSSNVACLGDFGLARFRDSQESSFSATTGNSVAGTLRWQAPELFVSRENGEHIHATPESDIYSFGCVCIEILTGKRPFAEISNDAAVMLAVVNKRKPQRPDEDLLRCGLDDALWETMERCWDINPYLRPPTHRLVKYFEQRKDLGPRGNDTCEHAEIPNALRCSLGQYGFPDDYVDSVSARQVLI